MKSYLLAVLTLGLVLLATGCDFSAEDDTSGVVTLTGQVLNKEDNNPVPGAFVQIMPQDLLIETDSVGKYRAEVRIDSTMDVTLTATKDGFGTDRETVLALAGREIEVPVMKLIPTADPEPVSGKASNILLLKQSQTSIGVIGSGSKEVATVTFQVTDSLGRPVILDHNAAVQFKFGVNPDGGEFIYPESAVTDNAGKVDVHLSSGTKAGVVQLVAETVVDGRAIVSRPVSVTIHGGLPDQAHFSFGPKQYNFPGLLTYGLENEVTVVVGDKYANPVKPGTSVYFTSTSGVIQGSLQTDAEGRGAVKLISGNPLPEGGVAVITATTADENENPVTGQIPLVFSSSPRVYVEPAFAQLDQTYTMLVRDSNGNPLSPGTTINVRVEGNKVKGVGNVEVELGDTNFEDGNRRRYWDKENRILIPDGELIGSEDGDILDYEDVVTGPGYTLFTFRAVEETGTLEDGDPVVEAITILISGPNGQFEVVLPPGINKNGSQGAYSPTEGVVATEVAGGMEFHLEK